MKIEKGIISSSQLAFLFTELLQASTLTGAFISGVTKQNTWVVLLVGFISTLLLLLVYMSLSEKFPYKNLVEINNEIYGNYFGKVISLLYIYFFWLLIPANLRYIADFFSSYLFSETDVSVFIIVVIIVCSYTIKKGIEVIARAGSIICVLSMMVALFITIFTIKDIRLSNFLPLFQMDLKEFVQGTNLMVTIPFGEIIVFLMIFPYVNDIRQVKKSAILGYIIGGIYFLLVILRNIAVLGNIGSIHVLQSYQVSRLINLGDVITRTEILIALVILFNVFLKVCLCYYTTVLSIAQFFKLRSYKHLVIPVGIISIVLAISMYNSPVEESYSATNIYPIYAIPFVIIFPVISLIIAYIRKLPAGR